MILKYHKNVTTFSYEHSQQLSKLSTLGFELIRETGTFTYDMGSYIAWHFQVFKIRSDVKFSRIRFKVKRKGRAHAPTPHSKSTSLSQSLEVKVDHIYTKPCLWVVWAW